jgi:aminopeptidase N
MKKLPVLFLLFAIMGTVPAHAQLFHKQREYDRADTLRGSITPEREWWDVNHYDLHVEFDPGNKALKGRNLISYTAILPGKRMQIDLQEPMRIDTVKWGGKKLSAERDGNVYYIDIPEEGVPGLSYVLDISYSGKPRTARFPWISVACQGLGASVWYPNKDHQSDEPDSATLHIRTPEDLTGVGNGKLIRRQPNNDGTITWTWAVTNPINNYNLIPYIGKYKRYGTTYDGEEGTFPLELWFLEPHLKEAKSHVLPDVLRTLEAFEYWFGPYPFYEDSYKMVEAPHLGMEHQSAIAYGNHFNMGYLGRDLSGSGEGGDWDYIVVHESGHEWFGNNISTNDIADMWVHEGFTCYSETLFVEYWKGKESGDRYLQGIRQNISNDAPIKGDYGVNAEGSGDMYPKGANLLHTIRSVMRDDSLFRAILRDLNKEFYHATVDSKDIEDYIAKRSGLDLSRVFAQYLQTTRIPVLEYDITEKDSKPVLTFRWSNIIRGFNMPVDILVGQEVLRITPSEEWQELELDKGFNPESNISIHPNFYVLSSRRD